MAWLSDTRGGVWEHSRGVFAAQAFGGSGNRLGEASGTEMEARTAGAETKARPHSDPGSPDPGPGNRRVQQLSLPGSRDASVRHGIASVWKGVGILIYPLTRERACKRGGATYPQMASKSPLPGAKKMALEGGQRGG